MRPLVAAFLIILHLLLSTAYGTRIGKLGIKSAQTPHLHHLEINNDEVVVLKQDGNKRVEQGNMGVRCKYDKDECAKSEVGTWNRRVSRVAKESEQHNNHHHWFPWIHEDYHGPKRHNPRHH